MKIKIITILIFLSFNSLFAIINTYEKSHTILKKIETSFESVSMNKINIEALIKEDEKNIGENNPMRYAHTFEVDYGIKKSGTWETLNDGSKIWRLGIQSSNAYGLKLFFDSFEIPEGAELYIFSKNPRF